MSSSHEWEVAQIAHDELAERARIVAWLRQEGRRLSAVRDDCVQHAGKALEAFAGLIEDGRHVQAAPVSK